MLGCPLYHHPTTSASSLGPAVSHPSLIHLGSWYSNTPLSMVPVTRDPLVVQRHCMENSRNNLEVLSSFYYKILL